MIKNELLNFFNNKETNRVLKSSYDLIDELKLMNCKRVDITKVVNSYVEMLLSIGDKNKRWREKYESVSGNIVIKSNCEEYIIKREDYEELSEEEIHNKLKQIIDNEEKDGYRTYYIDATKQNIELLYGTYFYYVPYCRKNKNFYKAIDVIFNESCNFDVDYVGFKLKYVNEKNEEFYVKSFIKYNETHDMFFVNPINILYSYTESGGYILVSHHDLDKKYEDEYKNLETKAKEILKKNSEKIVDNNTVFIDFQTGKIKKQRVELLTGQNAISIHNDKIYATGEEGKIIRNGKGFAHLILPNGYLKVLEIPERVKVDDYKTYMFDTNDNGEIIDDTFRIVALKFKDNRYRYDKDSQYELTKNESEKIIKDINYSNINALMKKYRDYEYDVDESIKSNSLYEKSKAIIYFYFYDHGIDRLDRDNFYYNREGYFCLEQIDSKMKYEKNIKMNLYILVTQHCIFLKMDS